MDARPARVTLTRRHKDDVRQRQIVASIDGAPAGTLLFGDTVTREVAPGAHRLRVHNTLFWTTRQLTLAPGDHLRFTVVNRAGLGSYWLLGLFGVGPLYVSVIEEPDVMLPPTENR
jgi:hypothetical protein